jgi:hypothetical protein
MAVEKTVLHIFSALPLAYFAVFNTRQWRHPTTRFRKRVGIHEANIGEKNLTRLNELGFSSNFERSPL